MLLHIVYNSCSSKQSLTPEGINTSVEDIYCTICIRPKNTLNENNNKLILMSDLTWESKFNVLKSSWKFSENSANFFTRGCRKSRLKLILLLPWRTFYRLSEIEYWRNYIFFIFIKWVSVKHFSKLYLITSWYSFYYHFWDSVKL